MIDIAFRAVPNAKKVGMLAGTYAFPQSHLAEIQPRLAQRSGVEMVVEQFDAAASDFTAQLISFAGNTWKWCYSWQLHGSGLCHQAGPGKGPDQRQIRGRRLGREQRHYSAHRRRENQITWGYFNAPYFPTQDDGPMASIANADLEDRKPAARPAKHLRPDRLRLTYVLAQVMKKAGRDLSWERLISTWETINDAKPSDLGS